MGIFKDIGFYLKNRQTLQALAEEQDFLNNYEDKVRETADFLERKLIGKNSPKLAMTLGSGLNGLVDVLEHKMELPYSEIPHFPTPTTEGHEGKLIYGIKGKQWILMLQGRKHYYEVADQKSGLAQISFPIDVIALLGVQVYLATNAAGALNQDYNIGDMMILDSHLSFVPDPRLGRHKFPCATERFQPMADAYDCNLRKILHRSVVQTGLHNEQKIHTGSYAAMTGPSYETEAQCKMLRSFGIDAVGMSTAPEVVVARNQNIDCVAFSCITNKVDENGKNPADHEDVKEILDKQETKDFYMQTVLNFIQNVGQVFANKSRV
ncbi:MAG: purine-nucleoside phosphorylase [archaeon]